MEVTKPSAPPSSSSPSHVEEDHHDGKQQQSIGIEPTEAVVVAAMASLPSPPQHVQPIALPPAVAPSWVSSIDVDRPPATAPIGHDSPSLVTPHTHVNEQKESHVTHAPSADLIPTDVTITTVTTPAVASSSAASAPPSDDTDIVTQPVAIPSLSSSSTSLSSSSSSSTWVPTGTVMASAPSDEMESKYSPSSPPSSYLDVPHYGHQHAHTYSDSKRGPSAPPADPITIRGPTPSSDSKLELSPSPSPPSGLTSPLSSSLSNDATSPVGNASSMMDNDDMMEPGAAEMVAAEDMILPTVAPVSAGSSASATVGGVVSGIASYVPFSLSSLPGLSSLSSSAAATASTPTAATAPSSESKYTLASPTSVSLPSSSLTSSMSELKRAPLPTTGLISDRLCTAAMRDMRDGIGELCDWFARKSTRLDGHFFRLVESFRQAQLAVLLGELQAKQATMQAEAQQKALWKIVKKTETKSQACGDGAMTTHTIHYHVAEFDRHGVEALNTHLATLRVQAVQDLATKRFLAVSNQLRIEAFLHAILSTHGITDLTSDEPVQGGAAAQIPPAYGVDAYGARGSNNSNSSSSSAPPVISQASLAQLRAILDVLFFFENKPADRDEEKLIAGYDDVRQQEQKQRDEKKKKEEKKEEKEKKAAAGGGAGGVDDEDPEDTAPIEPVPEEGDTEKSRVEFQRSIRKWIKIITETIYRLGSLFEHRYVLQHVLRTRGAMEWCSLLQCTRANQSHVRVMNALPKQTPQYIAAKVWSTSLHGWVWTEEYRQHILSMLALMLSPLKVARTRYSLAKRKALSAAPPGVAAATVAAGIVVPRRKRRTKKLPSVGTEKRVTDSKSSERLDGKDTNSTAVTGGNDNTTEVDGIRAWGQGATAAAAVDLTDEQKRLAERREKEADDNDESSSEEENDDESLVHDPAAAERKRALRTDSAMTAAALSDDGVMEARAAAWLEALPSADDIAGGWKLTEQDFANLLSDFPLMAFVRGLLLPLFVHHRRTALYAAATGAPSVIPSLQRQSSSGSSNVDPHGDLSEAFAKVRQVQALLAHALSQLREYPQFAKVLCKYLVSLPKAVVEIYTEAMTVTPTHDTFPMKSSVKPIPTRAPAYAPGFDNKESKEHKLGSEEKKGSSSSGASAKKAGGSSENSHKGQPGSTGLWIISDDSELASLDNGEGSLIGQQPRLGPARLVSWQQQVQAELDWLVLRGVCVIHGTSQPAARFFIAGFPFLYISPWAAGQVFAIMFFNAPLDQYSDSSRVFSPLVMDSWLAMIQADPQARTRFASSLSSPTQATYTLLALSRLCQHPYMTLNYVAHDPTPAAVTTTTRRSPTAVAPVVVGEAPPPPVVAPVAVVSTRTTEGVDDATGLVKTDLPFIFALELFQVAFIDVNTRNDIFKPSLDYFTAVTARHPRAVSLLLALTYYHFRYIQKASLPLFNCVDLSIWRPTSNDMRLLEALLLTSADTPGSFLARFMLQRMNYTMEDITPVSSDGKEIEHKDAPRAGLGSISSSGSGHHSDAHVLAPRTGPTPVLGWEFHQSMMLMLAAVRFTHLQPPATLTSRFTRRAAGGNGGVSYWVTSFTPFPSLPRLTFPPLAWGISEGSEGMNGRFSVPLHYEPLSSAGGVTGNAAAAVEYITGPMRISLASPVPAFWTDLLLRLHIRDQAGRPAIPPLHTWICSLFDIDSDEATPVAAMPSDRRSTIFSGRAGNAADADKIAREKAFMARMELVRSDAVLSYVQLQLTWHSCDIRRFNVEGWPMIRSMISITPSQPAFHPLAFRLVHDILPVMLRSAEANSVFSAWPHIGMPSPPPQSGPFLDGPSMVSIRSTIGGTGGTTGETGGGDDSTLLSIVHSFFDASRPRGLYSIFNKLSGKVPFSDYATGLANVAGAHILASSIPLQLITAQRMASPFYSAFATSATSPYASSAGWMPSSRWIDYWLSEVTYYEQSHSSMSGTTGGSTSGSTTGGGGSGSNSGVLPQGQWMKDPSCRYIVDFLCRAVLISTSSLFEPVPPEPPSAEDAAAAAGVIAIKPPTLRVQPTDALALLLSWFALEAGRPTFVDDFIVASPTGLGPIGGKMGGPEYKAIGGSMAASSSSSSSSSSSRSSSLAPPVSIFKDMKPTEWCPQYAWLSFVALMEETMADSTGWQTLGQLLVTVDPIAATSIKTVLAKLALPVELRYSSIIRRWARYALMVPPDHPLLPLYWQMFFRLYFARLPAEYRTARNLGAHRTNDAGLYGWLMLVGDSGNVLAREIRMRLNFLATYLAKERVRLIHEPMDIGVQLHKSVYELPQLFHAMSLWFKEQSGPTHRWLAHLTSSTAPASAPVPAPMSAIGAPMPSAATASGPAPSIPLPMAGAPGGAPQGLTDEYCPDRLASLLHVFPAAGITSEYLWLDLVDHHTLISQLSRQCRPFLTPVQPYTNPSSPASSAASPLSPSVKIGSSPAASAAAVAVASAILPMSTRSFQSLPTPGIGHSDSKRSASVVSESKLEAKDGAPVAAPAAPVVRTPAKVAAKKKDMKEARVCMENPFPPPVRTPDIVLVIPPMLQVPRWSMVPTRTQVGSGEIKGLAAAISGVSVGAGGEGNAVQAAAAASVAAALIASESPALPSDARAVAAGASLVAAIKSTVEGFAERFSRRAALDRQLLDYIPNQWRNEQTETKAEERCRLGLWGSANPRCKGAAQFFFHHPRAMKVASVDQLLSNNRQQADPLVASPEVTRELCAQLLAMNRLITFLVDSTTSQPGFTEAAQPVISADSMAALTECGVQWLYVFADLDSPVARLYPPVFFFLRQAVTSLRAILATALMLTHTQQARLLACLADHPFLIPILSPCLLPASVCQTPDQFLHLFRMAVNIRDMEGKQSTMVLHRFDFPAWMAARPSLPLRRDLFTVCGKNLRTEDGIIRAAEERRLKLAAAAVAPVIGANGAVVIPPVPPPAVPPLVLSSFQKAWRNDFAANAAPGQIGMDSGLAPVVLFNTASGSAVMGSGAASSAGAPRAAPPPPDACTLYSSFMYQLAAHNFPEMYMDFVLALLDDTFNPALLPATLPVPTTRLSNMVSITPPVYLIQQWERLATLPLTHLSFEQIQATCEALHRSAWRLRSDIALKYSVAAKKPGAEHTNAHAVSYYFRCWIAPFVPSLFTFFRHIFFVCTSPLVSSSLPDALSCRVTIDSPSSKKETLWTAVWQVFSAWLSPDARDVPGSFGDLATELSLGQQAPPTLNEPFIPGGVADRLMMDSFVYVVASLQIVDPTAVLQRLWLLYSIHICPNADSFFLSIFHSSIFPFLSPSYHLAYYHVPPPAAPDPSAMVTPTPSQPPSSISFPGLPIDFASFHITLRQLAEMRALLLFVIEQETLSDASARRADARPGAKQDAKAKQAAAPAVPNPPPQPVFAQPPGVVAGGAAGGGIGIGGLGGGISLGGGSGKDRGRKVGEICLFMSAIVATADWASSLTVSSSSILSPSAGGSGARSPRSERKRSPAPGGNGDVESKELLAEGVADWEIEGAIDATRSLAPSPYTVASPVPAVTKLPPSTPARYGSSLLWLLLSMIGEVGRAKLPFTMVSSMPPLLPLPLHIQMMLRSLFTIEWSRVFNVAPAEDADPGAGWAAASDREVEECRQLLEEISRLLYSPRWIDQMRNEGHILAAAANTQPLLDHRHFPAVAANPNTFASIYIAQKESLLPQQRPGAPPPSAALLAQNAMATAAPFTVYPFTPPRPSSWIFAPLPMYTITCMASLPPALVRSSHNYQAEASPQDLRLPTGEDRRILAFQLMYAICGPFLPPLLSAAVSSASAYGSGSSGSSALREEDVRSANASLSLALRKSRLFVEWLMSVFAQPSAQLPMLAAPPRYSQLVTSTLTALDSLYMSVQPPIRPSDEQFVTLLQELMFIPNLVARNVPLPTVIIQMSDSIFRHYPSLLLLAMCAVCRSVVALPSLSTLLEQCISSYIESHAPYRPSLSQFLSPSPIAAGIAQRSMVGVDNHWLRIAAVLQVPELSYNDFVGICLENGRLNTLHAIAIQRLQYAWQRASLWIVLDTEEQLNANAIAARVLPRHPVAVQPSAPGGVPAPPLSPIPRPTAWPAPPVSALEPHPLQMMQAQLDQFAGWCNVAKTQPYNPQLVDDDKTGDLAKVGAHGVIAADVPVVARGADRYHEAYKLIPMWRTLLHWQAALSQRVSQRAQSVQGRLDSALVTMLTNSADTTMDQLIKSLLRLTVETKWGGVIGYLGIGGLRHSSRFRLAARTLCSHLLLYQRGGIVAAAVAASRGKPPVINPVPQPNIPLHFDWDGRQPIDHELRTALLNEFAGLATSRSYGALASLVPLLGARLILNATPPYVAPRTAIPPSLSSPALPPSSGAASGEEKKTPVVESPVAEPGTEPGFTAPSATPTVAAPVVPSTPTPNSGMVVSPNALTFSHATYFIDELMAIIYPLVPSSGILPTL